MSTSTSLAIGVDTGGTFTDLIAVHADGSVEVHKVLSTPEDPSRAILSGVEALLDATSWNSFEVIHGTTVATNALLERKGARVAFLTTAGFEDLLFLGRQHRPELYALAVERAQPPIGRDHCLGVSERLGANGEVLQALSTAQVDEVIRRIEALDVESVVISFLHSYVDGAHEDLLRDALNDHGNGRWHLSVSHEVTPTFREYERSATTLINGYVGPVMKRYLSRLSEGLQAADRLEILQSHGGRTEVTDAGDFPVHTVLSGPAGGVVGALAAAREVGFDDIITFDMGGTSSDVSLARGTPEVTEDSRIGGLPLQVPVIDIFTVGAGGGSIAYLDDGGAMRVGPRSAGAQPGPAAYARGGQEPTVTDAHVVLGSLLAHRFLGGAMTLDVDAAQLAINSLAAEAGLSMAQTARGILDIADMTMARAIKVVSLERGHDPRDYTLVSFGGAGGLHACRLADLLEIPRVLVPRYPGLLSAMGMLQSQRKRLYSKTYFLNLDAASPQIWQTFHAHTSQMVDRARAELGDSIECFWQFSLRYVGQSFGLPVRAVWIDERLDVDRLRRDFHDEHHRRFGYGDSEAEVELVGMRLEARVPREPLRLAEEVAEQSMCNEREECRIDLGRGPENVAVVARQALKEGERLQGPAVITEYSGTTVVLNGWQLQVCRGHLLLESSTEVPSGQQETQ